jgi:hypothetical protein
MSNEFIGLTASSERGHRSCATIQVFGFEDGTEVDAIIPQRDFSKSLL